MPEKYWIVELKAYAFDTKEQAKAFASALNEAFCAMPEAEEYAASVCWREDDGGE